MKKSIAFVLTIAMTLLFSGCFLENIVKLKINFVVDGEIYATVSTDKSSINMPADPTKDGHEFDGWFWDNGVWQKPFTLNSLMDAPLFENLRVYAKFSESGGEVIPPVVSAGFYRMQEAYDLGILNYGNLYDISFHHHGIMPMFPPLSRAPFPKNPEYLSGETENKIKQTFLDDFYSTIDVGCIYKEYTLDHINITNYCGTYNGAVVVFIEGLYGYDEALSSETVAGITFNYRDGNYLRVWVEESENPIPFSVGLIENHGDTLEYAPYTAILKAPFSCESEGDLMNGFGFWLNYDEAFFYDNALVVYLFNASTMGGSLDVLRLAKQNKKLIMDIDFVAGYADALSSWTVVLEVAKADIAGSAEVVINEVENTDPFPYATEANLVQKYVLTFEAYIWNDYMPPVIDDRSNCYINIYTGAVWIEPVPHPFYGYLAMSVRIVTATKDFQTEFVNHTFGLGSMFRPATYFRLDDREVYTAYITIAFGGEKQTITLTGKTDVTH